MGIISLNSLVPKEEHGEFTPTLEADSIGTMAVTYSSQLGYYSKIGNTVTVNIYIGINTFTLGTATGLAFVRTNLPVKFNSSNYSPLPCRVMGPDLTDTSKGINAAIGGDGSQVYIFQTQDNANAIHLPISAFAAGDFITISGSYITAW